MKCHYEPFAVCHSEPFALYHSEPKEKNLTVLRTRLGEESQGAQDRLLAMTWTGYA